MASRFHSTDRRLQSLASSICAGANKDRSIAAAAAAAPAPVAEADTSGATVALISHAGGPHVTAYMDGLAAATAVTRVVLGDMDGNWLLEAEARLGNKLAVRAAAAAAARAAARTRTLPQLLRVWHVCCAYVARFARTTRAFLYGMPI